MSAVETYWSTYESPIGELTLVARGGRLREVRFPGGGNGLTAELCQPDEFANAVRQLDEYFVGERRAFDLQIELLGSPFQRAVWTALREIPFGETVSYGEIAKRLELDGPEAARDVGTAVGQTPTPIVIPCHRVIGANGDLTGYGGGLDRKRALLDLEASQLSLL
ncbi:MAG TPA: methylated-DNA--[protein]-cysteine S-methyltransferase [Solirubrobacterales bacterium]|nr:methylated-DNA--[protein]-cysteine S-methyltransferase [Solirubrobacterales bacterium]